MFGIKSKIISTVRELLGPESLMLSPIGFNCNNNCVMCWRNSIDNSDRQNILENEIVDISVYKNAFDKLPSTVRTIEIQGGGEPLLYKEIDKLFSLVKEKYCGGLITNGILLDKHIKTLTKTKWDYVRISINSASKETYIKVNGSNSFEKVINNIRGLNLNRDKTKTKIILHFVIQKYNFFEIKQLFELAKEVGADEISFDYVLPFGKDKDKLIISEEKWSVIESDIADLLSKKDICKNNLDKILYMRKNHPFWQNKNNNEEYLTKHSCNIVRNTLYVLSDGTCLPCCLADKKIFNLNIKNEDIGKIWRKYFSLRQKIKKKDYFWFCRDLCNYKIE